jgi:predicted dehydrogenase
VAELKVGVVGSGWVATDRYLPVLQRLDEVTIVGVADRNHDRAMAVAEDYETSAFSDAGDLIDLRPDVLFVCTSPFSHATIAIAAMENGIDVFVEKPMALDSSEAATMVATSAETGQKLGVSHNMLFARSVRAAQRHIKAGRLGKVRQVLALQASNPHRRLPHWYPELRGGLFFDEAPHMVYLLDAFLGGMSLDHVWSDGVGQFTSLGAVFVGDDEIRGLLTMIFDAPITEWFLTIFCEKGVVVIDLFRDTEFVIPPDGSHRPFQVLRTSVSSFLGHGFGVVTTGARYVSRRQFWGHEVIIADFLDAVRDGTAPTISGKDGARVLTKMIEILDMAGA